MALVTGAELEEFRADAESLMLDTGKALRPTGGRAYDAGTQTEVDVYDDLFGPVACKIKPSGLSTHTSEAGERTVVTIPAGLHLPATAQNAGLVPGDVWEIVSAHAQSLSTVGRRYRVTSEVDGTIVTACRYSVERVA